MTRMEEKKDYSNELLNIEDVDKVVGVMYLMTNTVINKSYIGQTRSHRLNHGKYRPFGHMGRFRHHISEAINEKNHSRYLDNAIMSYGSDKFTCHKILECRVDELNDYEVKFIKEYNTLYPNGYNLTPGGNGKGKGNRNIDELNFEKNTLYLPPEIVRVGPTRIESTKKLISERLKVYLADEGVSRTKMLKTQEQHLLKKFELFKNVKIEDDLQKYIFNIKPKDSKEYIKVMIDRIVTTFYGKHESIDEIKERAIHFIEELKVWQTTKSV
jgi:hypothetical protein